MFKHERKIFIELPHAFTLVGDLTINLALIEVMQDKVSSVILLCLAEVIVIAEQHWSDPHAE